MIRTLFWRLFFIKIALFIPIYGNASNSKELLRQLDSVQAFIDSQNFERADSLAKTIIKDADLNELWSIKAIGYNYLGTISTFINPDRSAAVEHFKTAVKIAHLSDSAATLAAVYNNLGTSYLQQSKLELAKEYLLIALDYAIQAKSDFRIGMIYSALGIIYNYLNEIDTAKKYATLARKKFVEVDYLPFVALESRNLSNIYISLENTDSAIHFAKFSLSLSDQMNDAYSICKSNLFLAQAYLNGKMLDSAEHYAKKAFSCAESFGDPKLRARSIQQMGLLMLYQNKNDSALLLTRMAIRMTRDLEDYKQLENCYRNIAQIQAKLGASDSVLYYSDKQLEAKEMYLSEAKQHAVIELQEKYDAEKSKRQIEVLTLKNENISKTRSFYTILTIILVLVIIGIYFYQRAIIKRNHSIYKVENDLKESQLQLARNEVEHHQQQLDNIINSSLEKHKLMSDLAVKVGIDPHLESDKYNALLDNLKNHKLLTNEDWGSFKKHYDKVYPGKRLKMHRTYTKLTNAEERLFLLIGLGLNRQEIASILAISKDSVKRASSRLRKKLELNADQKLDEYIRSFDFLDKVN